MKYKLLFLFLFFFSPALGQLQGQQLIDSILYKLPSIKDDTNKVKVLHVLSDAYKTIDVSKAIKYANQELEIAKAFNWKGGIALAYISLGRAYQYKSDYEKALAYFNDAYLICSEKRASSLYGFVINSLAIVYQELGNYDKALDYNLKSLALNKNNDDKVNQAGDYGNIGIIYLLKKDYAKALEYDTKSLEIFLMLGDKDGEAHNYGNIGNVYKESGNYILALEYDFKALELFKELGDRGGIAINMGNIGGVYLHAAMFVDSTAKPGITPMKGSKKWLLSSAIKYFNESIEISRQNEQLDNIIEFSLGLYEAQSMAGNEKAALAAYKEYVLYKDSVYSDESRLRIANLDTERELSLKEKQIQINKLEIANKRKERMLFVAILVLLIVVTSVVTQKFLNQKRKSKQLAVQQKEHIARIEKQKMVMGNIAYTHSHDVSGQVATIMGLVKVFNTADYTDPDNKIVIDGIGETAEKLDIIVKDMIVKENMLNPSKQ